MAEKSIPSDSKMLHTSAKFASAANCKAVCWLGVLSISMWFLVVEFSGRINYFVYGGRRRALYFDQTFLHVKKFQKYKSWDTQRPALSYQLLWAALRSVLSVDQQPGMLQSLKILGRRGQVVMRRAATAGGGFWSGICHKIITGLWGARICSS